MYGTYTHWTETTTVNANTAGHAPSPLLDVLSDNGGATWTHALITGSVAIDAGNPAPIGSDDGACPPIDQRGVPRPGGSSCDLGAFELSFLQAQTIAFDLIPDHFVTDAPFVITATASSGLAVSFNAGGVCSVNGLTVTLSGIAGSCTITATQAGNAIYSPATPVTRSFSVQLATQTITFDAIPDQLIDNSPFVITATASSGLNVAIASLTTSVCSVNNYQVALLSVGTCTLRASQSDNATYAAASDVDRSFTVKPAYKIYLPLVLR